MTVSPLHPAPQGPSRVAERVAAVHGLLDELLAGRITADDAVSLGEVSRARTRLDALRFRLISAAESGDVAGADGQASTADWVRKQTRTTGQDSARDTSLSRSLGREDAPQSPTRAALEAGEIAAEHARVITDALRRLPDGTTSEQRLACERRLVDQAKRYDPAQLRRLARRVLAEIEPDPVAVDAAEDAQVVDEEDAAYAAAKLTFHDHGDGTVSGHFRLPTLHADVLRKVVNAMTAPRRSNVRDARRARHTASHGLAETNPLERDRVDPAHARGLALAQLLEHLPTEHLHGAAATQVTVLMDIATLQGHLKAAGLDTDQPISAGEARRMACNSAIVPVVLGRTLSGKSRVLDLGRLSRLFTEAQRHAVIALHTHCAARGCTRPIAWCELHHATPWSHGGRTDLDQAVPLCGWHHRRIHDHRYHHTYEVDGSVTIKARV